MTEQMEQHEITPDDQVAEDALRSIFDDTFTVTVAGLALVFKKATLRQAMKVDKVYDEVDDVETTTEIVGLVLPLVEDQLTDYDGPDLLDVLTEQSLMWLLAALRGSMTIDFDSKKN